MIGYRYRQPKSELGTIALSGYVGITGLPRPMAWARSSGPQPARIAPQAFKVWAAGTNISNRKKFR